MIWLLLHGKQSTLPLNDNQNTTQEPTYTKENISEINDIIKLPEGIFTINNWPISMERTQPNG